MTTAENSRMNNMNLCPPSPIRTCIGSNSNSNNRVVTNNSITAENADVEIYDEGVEMAFDIGLPSSTNSHSEDFFNDQDGNMNMDMNVKRSSIQTTQQCVASSVSIRSKKRKKKPKDKPKRPLSAYNIFFRDERIRLLASLEAADEPRPLHQGRNRGDDFISGEFDASLSRFTDMFLDLSKEEIDTLAQGTASDSSEDLSKKKSPSSEIHRQEGDAAVVSSLKKLPHGKISFENMAKVIGGRWKNLSSDKLEYYKNLAGVDAERYRVEMEKYNARIKLWRQSSLKSIPNSVARFENKEESFDMQSHDEDRYEFSGTTILDRLGEVKKSSSQNQKGINGVDYEKEKWVGDSDFQCILGTYAGQVRDSSTVEQHQPQISSNDISRSQSHQKSSEQPIPGVSAFPPTNENSCIPNFPSDPSLSGTMNNPFMGSNFAFPASSYPTGFHPGYSATTPNAYLQPNFMSSLNQSAYYQSMRNMQVVMGQNGQQCYKMVDDNGTVKTFHLEYMQVPYNYMISYQQQQNSSR